MLSICPLVNYTIFSTRKFWKTIRNQSAISMNFRWSGLVTTIARTLAKWHKALWDSCRFPKYQPGHILISHLTKHGWLTDQSVSQSVQCSGLEEHIYHPKTHTTERDEHKELYFYFHATCFKDAISSFFWWMFHSIT